MFSWVTKSIVKYLEQGLIYVANLLIHSIATLIGVLITLLPPMPSVPSAFSGSYLTWVSYGEYWFPVNFLLSTGASMLVLWFASMLILIPFRWAKAVRGGE